jgi:hypothetical protein
MNLLLFEPDLVSAAGHYNRYVRVLAAEAARCGVKLSVACNAGIMPGMRETMERLGVEIIPAFPRHPYNMLHDPALRTEVSRILAKAALSCFAERSQAKVAWLSGTGALFGAACMFAKEAKVPFVLQMIDFARDWPKGRLTAPTDIRELAASAVDNAMRVYVQSPLIAKCFEDEVGIPARTFPAILDLKPLGKREYKGRPVIGIMNMMRRSKQPWRAIEALVAHADSLSIVLHMGQGTTGTDLGRVKRDLNVFIQRYGVKVPLIKIATGILKGDAYNALWQQLDCAVMPYWAEQYSRQGSGMLFESLADGIIPIAPSATSMADLMKQESVGVAYDSCDPQALQGAIGTLVSDFPSLATQSRARAGAYREANSPSKVMSLVMET